MKDLYSISGLLPAQYRDDFEKEVDSKEPEYECLVCGDSGRSHQTLANPDGEVCECVKDDNEINVGDWVQVLPNYDNEYGDELNPGGIYVVRKKAAIYDYVLILSNQLDRPWILRRFVRKIDLRIGMRVKTLGEVAPPGTSVLVSGSGRIQELDREHLHSAYRKCIPYRVHIDRDHGGFNGVLWFEEGTLTLDD